MKYLIVSSVVILILGLIQKGVQKENKKKCQNEKKFVARVTGIMLILGAIIVGIIVATLIYMIIDGQTDDTFTVVGLIVAGIILGIIPMLIPMPGFWEIRVDGDDICVVKCFLFKKHYKFSELIQCKMTRGGAKFFIEGRSRKAFFLERMMIGADLFMKRVNKAGIPIEEFVDKSLE